MRAAKRCPDCPDDGWKPVLPEDMDRSDVVPMPCTFCHTEPDSVFNIVRECEALTAALVKIDKLDPNIDSVEGYNEWGEADCFRQAQTIARAAIGASNG